MSSKIIPYSFVEKYWTENYGTLVNDWTFVTAGDIFTDSSETSSDKSKYPLYSLTIENGVTPKSERYEREFLLKDAENNEYKVVHDRQFVFNPMNLRFGAIARAKLDFSVLVSGYYNVLTLDESRASGEYVNALLKTNFFKYLYETVATGSLNEKKRVHWSDFQRLQLPLPSLVEQEKIAKILSTWDEAIDKLESLISRKKERNLNLLRDLLNNSRFPLQTMGSFFKVQNGYAFKSQDFKDEGVPLIRISNIQEGYVSLEGGVYLDESASVNNQFLVRAGDVLIAMSGATTGKFGIYQDEKAALLNQRVGKFEVVDKEITDKRIVRYLLVFLQDKILDVAAGGAQPNISSKDIESMQIRMPNFESQKMICDILDLSNSEIKILNAKRMAIITQKSALMSQMLTGKKRVVV